MVKKMLVNNSISMYIHRQVDINNKNQIGIMEKISSGYKINRSADDAAGLSISEKMRYQIRGLNKASNNIQDGISFVQVAEGALNEVHSLLQRMRELTVQGANDTNTEEDRQAIQDEIVQLEEECDRIFKTTDFNTQKIWAMSWVPTVEGVP